MTSITALKKRLREEAAKQRDRAAADNDIGERLTEAFNTALSPAANIAVSGYYPIGSEANVLPLLNDLSARGLAVALPIVSERGKPLTFRKWQCADAMDRGSFGIPEPQEAASIVRPDLVLAPLLAFDRTGNRLGYGGGYYDMTIAALREDKPVLVVGIAYAAQQVPQVPHGDDDVLLDWIITENEAFRPELGNK